MLAVLVILALSASTAGAQRNCRRYVNGRVVVCDQDRHERRRRWDPSRVEFGIRGGYDFDGNQGSAGTQLRIPVVRQFQIVPSFDAFFGDTGATWQLNGDAFIRLDQLGGLYFGGGAAAVRREFEDGDGNVTKAGWNLLLGLDGQRISATALRPFAEARWTGVGDFTAFRLVAGINVPVGGF